MNIIFGKVDTFLSSIRNYWSHSEIFVLGVGLFLFTIICVIISTSHAYEARLIKAIDMFNNYFIDNPQINENNLVAFNAKMKTKKVPKQLRKQWQQFVLYREGKASEYMSFETCVSTPIKNSTFKRDVVTMNIISYLLAATSLMVNLYISYKDTLAEILKQAMLSPILILILNFIITIFLDIRHNAIVSDLYSNYQYFEVNIDKATQTLPEYVDYEVLFDKNEIKKGIPILYAYLQKRAEEEQRELERARLRNVEHEKFHFDESGVESSLVLDRAMQEAENYIAERKKYMQDMQQINAEISQEDASFREITKEYQRQMQVSKESFDNYKSQLNEASSTIESNYLKKQQQQELDRQRNLERDYDTASDRHKKVIESYQAELTTIEGFIEEARKTLERGMMSEFETYSNKVYDAASKVVEEREEEKTTSLKKQIQDLEEQLSAKSKELEYVYSQNQALSEKFDQQANEFQQKLNQNNQVLSRVSDEISRYNNETMSTSYDVQQIEQPEEYLEEYPEETFDEPVYEEPYAEASEYQEEPVQYQEPVEEYQQEVPTEEPLNFKYSPYQEEQVPMMEQPVAEEEFVFNYSPYNDEDEGENEDTGMVYTGEQPTENNFDLPVPEEIEEEQEEVKEPVVSEPIAPIVATSEEVPEIKTETAPSSTEPKAESTPIKRKAGRPRKVVSEGEIKQPKRRGRPRKVANVQGEQKQSAVKKGRGRPKKVETSTQEVPTTSKKGRGRPRKIAKAEAIATKKGRGRPRKVQIETAEIKTATAKKGRGRPKKVQQTNVISAEPKHRGRPRKVEVVPVKKGRGRPRKIDVKPDDNIEDIDAYLKEINDEIAKENARIAESAKALERKAKIAKKK